MGACLYSSILHSKIIKDDLYVKKESFHSFKEVCQKLAKHDSPLIEKKSITKLDCMGTEVVVGKYCASITEGDHSYARGLVSGDQVKCVHATRAILSYECVSGSGLCEDKDIGCYKLQEQFAQNLYITHASVTEKESSKLLHCYFSETKGDESLKPRI